MDNDTSNRTQKRQRREARFQNRINDLQRPEQGKLRGEHLIVLITTLLTHLPTPSGVIEQEKQTSKRLF